VERYAARVRGLERLPAVDAILAAAGDVSATERLLHAAWRSGREIAWCERFAPGRLDLDALFASRIGRPPDCTCCPDEVATTAARALARRQRQRAVATLLPAYWSITDEIVAGAVRRAIRDAARE
jgi:hypothetical protein